jgi:hypothetical protein
MVSIFGKSCSEQSTRFVEYIMPKAGKEKTSVVKLRHDPLSADIERPTGKLREAKPVSTYKMKNRRGYKEDVDDLDEDMEDKYIDPKILKEAKLQRDEIYEYRVPTTQKMSKPVNQDIDSEDEYEVLCIPGMSICQLTYD